MFNPALLAHQWYMLWFNFLLDLHFISLCFELIIAHYHTPKQREIKFKPRIKLNKNWGKRALKSSLSGIFGKCWPLQGWWKAHSEYNYDIIILLTKFIDSLFFELINLNCIHVKSQCIWLGVCAVWNISDTLRHKIRKLNLPDYITNNAKVL